MWFSGFYGGVLRLRVKGLRVCGLGFCFGLWVLGFGFCVLGFGFRVWGALQISGVKMRIQEGGGGDSGA